MPADDIEVIHMTAAERDRALQASLDKLGLTWDQLTAQAKARDFTSLEAQQLWLLAGGQGPDQAAAEVARLRVAVEREQQRTEAALAERDQQFERKCEALRERDAARRELVEAQADLQARIDDQAMTAAYVGDQLGFNQPLPAITAIGCAMALGVELAEARAERDDLRARHTGALIHAHRLTGRIAINSEPWTVLEALIVALNTPQTTETTTPAQEKV